jgi:hypothetical protein
MRRASDFLAAFGATRSPSSSSRMKREAVIEIDRGSPATSRRVSDCGSDGSSQIKSHGITEDNARGSQLETSEDELSVGDTIQGTYTTSDHFSAILISCQSREYRRLISRSVDRSVEPCLLVPREHKLAMHSPRFAQSWSRLPKVLVQRESPKRY